MIESIFLGTIVFCCTFTIGIFVGRTIGYKQGWTQCFGHYTRQAGAQKPPKLTVVEGGPNEHPNA